MSNPFTRTTATWPKGPAQGTDNLTSLASNNAKGLGAVNPATQPAYDLLIAPLKITTGTGTSTTGTVSVYLVASEDNTVWPGGINPDSTSDQTAALSTATLLETITANADTTAFYSQKEYSVVGVLGFMPSYVAIIVQNNSGATLSATAGNHTAKYSEDTYN